MTPPAKILVHNGEGGGAVQAGAIGELINIVNSSGGRCTGATMAGRGGNRRGKFSANSTNLLLAAPAGPHPEYQWQGSPRNSGNRAADSGGG